MKKRENPVEVLLYTIDYNPGAGITHLDIDLVPSFMIGGRPDVAIEE